MAITLELGTPGADQLQRDVHTKLVEMGYSQGGSAEDTALAEYIVINVVNDKDMTEFTTELATEFLQTDPNNQALVSFVRGVFEHAEALSSNNNNNNNNGAGGDSQIVNQAADTIQEDAEMGDGADAQADSTNGGVPTGPKSMRNGRGRDRRGGLNRGADRSGDAALHGVRNGGGIGKVDTRGGRGARNSAPRGPRGGLQKNITPHQQQQLGAMAMGAGPMGMGGNLTPEQQLEMIRIHEAASQMLQQSFMAAGQFPFAQRGGRFNGNRGFKNQRGGFNKQHGNHDGQNNGSDAMDLTSANGDAEGSARFDPSQTVCKFNADCTKADCPFAHRGPYSPLHTSIDLSTTCSYGANCTNRKCVSKHPSPAAREVPLCTYFPNCTKPNCPFKHPDTPPCRNGADCTDANCKFWHSQTACKYTPCTRQDCPFKHAEGQKQKPGSHVWINPELQAKEHVSERKFVDGSEKAEELILPEQQQAGEVDMASAGID